MFYFLVKQARCSCSVGKALKSVGQEEDKEMREEGRQNSSTLGTGGGLMVRVSHSGLCLAAWGLHPAPLPGVPKSIWGEWDPHQEDRLRQRNRTKRRLRIPSVENRLPRQWEGSRLSCEEQSGLSSPPRLLPSPASEHSGEAFISSQKLGCSVNPEPCSHKELPPPRAQTGSQQAPCLLVWFCCLRSRACSH